ncbi:MAG TPA: hypothetical protein VI282_19065, partial [Verrucomicrobiae bacterium]
MHHTIQRRRLNAVFLAEFVNKKARGFGWIVNELRAFRNCFCHVMINDQPILPIESRLKRQIA